MKTDLFLKNKISKLNNGLNVNDEVFDSIYSFHLLKEDNELSEKFMSLYNSDKRLVASEHDDFFYKAFKTFLKKNQK